MDNVRQWSDSIRIWVVPLNLLNAQVPSLFCVREMHLENGPPLPLGEQLRRLSQLQSEQTIIMNEYDWFLIELFLSSFSCFFLAMRYVIVFGSPPPPSGSSSASGFIEKKTLLITHTSKLLKSEHSTHLFLFLWNSLNWQIWQYTTTNIIMIDKFISFAGITYCSSSLYRYFSP